MVKNALTLAKFDNSCKPTDASKSNMGAASDPPKNYASEPPMNDASNPPMSDESNQQMSDAWNQQYRECNVKIIPVHGIVYRIAGRLGSYPVRSTTL